jgi:hypothetical protein
LPFIGQLGIIKSSIGQAARIAALIAAMIVAKTVPLGNGIGMVKDGKVSLQQVTPMVPKDTVKGPIAGKKIGGMAGAAGSERLIQAIL